MLDDKRVPIEYWCQPKKGSWSKITEQRFVERAKAPLRIPLEIYLPWLERFRQLRQEDTPNPSLGLSSIIFASAMLHPKQITLVGFDNLLNPNLLWYDRSDKGLRWTTRHEWHVEHEMLPMIEKEYGTSVTAMT